MPTQKLKQYLDENNVKYVRIIHSPAYTSQEIAASAHVPGRELAKTVMVKVDGQMGMAVVPATRQVDPGQLADVAGAEKVDVATEEEFKDMFPQCEVGAMPPFGNLYNMPVCVDEALEEDEEIVFNAGTHAELVRMDYRDFKRLVQPVIGTFAR